MTDSGFAVVLFKIQRMACETYMHQHTNLQTCLRLPSPFKSSLRNSPQCDSIASESV